MAKAEYTEKTGTEGKLSPGQAANSKPAGPTFSVDKGLVPDLNASDATPGFPASRAVPSMFAKPIELVVPSSPGPHGNPAGTDHNEITTVVELNPVITDASLQPTARKVERSEPEKQPFSAEIRNKLRIVEQSPGSHILWEVPTDHHFKAGTNFPQDGQGDHTRNKSVEGTLGEITGGSAHMYLLSRDEEDEPSLCFVSDTPLANISQMKDKLAETVQTSGVVPYIQDKATGLFIIPVSQAARKKVGETMFVGQQDQSHRNLHIFPLLTRDLLDKDGVLTDSYTYAYERQLKYGDLLRTKTGNLYTTLLAKEYSPQALELLHSLDIAAFDTIPEQPDEPAITHWYDMLKSLMDIQSPSDLLRKYVESGIIFSVEKFTSFMASQNYVAFTPGLFDGESVDEEDRFVSLHDPAKDDILEAVSAGYDPDTGLPSKALVLYTHPTIPDRYLLVIGGNHLETERYVTQVAKQYARNHDTGKEYTPVALAQLAGSVFFEKPENLHKSSYGYTTLPLLDVRITLDAIQSTPHIPVNHDHVRTALEVLQTDHNTRVKLEMSEGLEEQLGQP